MGKYFEKWSKAHPVAQWFYPVWVLITVVAFVSAAVTGDSFGWGYTCLLVLIGFAFRPNSMLHTDPVGNGTDVKRLCTVLVALVTVATCILPMDALPLWNGETPDHRNQYELMAENILEGRIDFAYGDEDTLLELENPYDPDERDEAGVWYHWDHAYYNGHYYMYFGIVPVLLTFLPYRILTGAALTTYHATQIYTAFAIIGIFALFAMLAKRFFKSLPYCVYLALSVAFSVMSVWYATAEPALYCTAITAAIALELWSLYFFVRGVYVETKENRQILFAGIGAVLGALVFGCRPPIALANILVLPMLGTFLHKRKITGKLLGKLALAALPYVIVAAGLMLYNYARFDDPFEFGQKYQLTVADQSQYSIVWNKQTILRVINEAIRNFFAVGTLGERFPFLRTSSVVFNFPVLLLCVGGLNEAVLNRMGQARVLPLAVGIPIAVLVITAMDVLWTPYLLERYRMDIYFLMGLGCFLSVGFWYETGTVRQRARLSSAAVILSVLTVVSAFLLCVYTIGIYYPDKVAEIAKNLRLT